ncbi:MAG: YdeI/OmpD-associated family protein [Flavobacterium sp.]|nr:YdeI/OmpD-associated family protein [Flavobacterium sp.]MBP6099054.1 YdeI/OmpD-associated family protein [Flavobacterium sp.]
MEEKHTWNKVHTWQKELEALQKCIAKTELVATLKWGAPAYTLNNKNVIGIGGFKNFFTIWFFNGVFLKDDLKVLVNANEGVTKALRQWRFTHMDQIDEVNIIRYINEAIENEKKGWVLKPSKKEKVVCPYFEEVLKQNQTLKVAFEKLSEAKQNDYMEYIESAKQEKTKQSRSEKITPMILEGKGLNDAYKK